MKNSDWRIFHPATLYLSLTILVILLSWIFDIYGSEFFIPQLGEEVRIQSLISPEGIRWLLRNVVGNFTGFAPLGMVIVAMFGIGVAQHSGFIDACIRSRKHKQSTIILTVIMLGLVSNVIGDAGYIILLPISATLFHHIGLHPIVGIITSYVSVACGYSANVVLSTMDPLLSRITEEAAMRNDINNSMTGPLSNYYFMLVSTFVIAYIIYQVTTRKLIKQVGVYSQKDANHDKPLSLKERRGLIMTLFIGFLYLVIILFSTFSSFGILRGVSGNLMRSPFIMGILFLISFGIGLMGMVYGFSSGRYRSDIDVIQGLSQPMKLLSVYFVIAFFAAQMFACLEYSNLDKLITILSANSLSQLNITPFLSIILFIILSALINFFMVSATSKWGFIAFIFVPLFGQMGISPNVVQCAFRIGDSSTNAITPFLFYMPLVLTYMLQYNYKATYISLFRYTWRFSLYILMAWIILFIFWMLTDLPLGI